MSQSTKSDRPVVFIDTSTELPSLADIRSSYVGLRQLCMPRMSSVFSMFTCAACRCLRDVDS